MIVLDDEGSETSSVGSSNRDFSNHMMNNYAAEYDATSLKLTVNVLGKDDIDDFMAWGFFWQVCPHLVDWERDEMIYVTTSLRICINTKPGRSPNYRLRQFCCRSNRRHAPPS
jgi:hypothetical protein